MCGLLTYFGGEKKDLTNLADNLTSRGPDDQASLHIDNSSFYFSRLSIIGQGEGGSQPIQDSSGITLTCNGEIYNYKNLIDKFKLKTTTASDCEVILLLYKKLGLQETLNLLDGVFFFTLYDPRKKELFAARDPFGVRPGFIGCDAKDGVFISSEVKAIPESVTNISSFNPGCWWSSEKQTFKRYFDNNFSSINVRSEELILSDIRESLVEAVEKRLMSEREIGCLLSGGLDSSLIAALVCKMNDGYRLRDNVWRREFEPSAKKIKTFSIGMSDSPDLKYAKEVADFIGSDHYTVQLSQQDFLEAIPEVVYKIESYDTTTVRASVGNYLVSKFIKDNTNCKVIFNGDGSDEVCCGYVYNINAPNPDELHKESKRLLDEIHYFDVLRSDRSISSNGLEPRTPFLDKEFVNIYMSIDPALKTFDKKNKIEKHLLRKAFSKDHILPDSVLWRHKCAFSDGVSDSKTSWHNIIKEHVDKKLSDEEFCSELSEIDHCKPLLKESLYYRQIFNETYSHCQNIIPHFWMPKWTDVIDPSARELSLYKE